MNSMVPSIAQLVERRTVEITSDILRSLVRIRLEGNFISSKFPTEARQSKILKWASKLVILHNYQPTESLGIDNNIEFFP